MCRFNLNIFIYFYLFVKFAVLLFVLEIIRADKLNPLMKFNLH